MEEKITFEVRPVPDEAWKFQVWYTSHQKTCNHFPVLLVDSNGAADDLHLKIATLCCQALNDHYRRG